MEKKTFLILIYHNLNNKTFVNDTKLSKMRHKYKKKCIKKLNLHEHDFNVFDNTKSFEKQFEFLKNR